MGTGKNVEYRIYIGKRIAEERSKLGLSQRDLAGLSGYDPATIANEFTTINIITIISCNLYLPK